MPESRERLTARKVTAEDIIEGNYYEQDGFDPNYLLTTYGLRVSRARVLGTVVDRYVNDDESYGALTLDDGSATLRAKFFQDLEMMDGVGEGDIVEVIGKVKEYDGERYITPELVVHREPTMELVRALELAEVRDRWREHVNRAQELQGDGTDEEDVVQELQGAGLPEQDARAVVQYLDMAAEAFETAGGAGAPEESGGEDDAQDGRASVLNAIESLDDGDGVEYGAIQDEADVDEDALEDVINDLLSDGTCYEPRPGRIKRL